MAELETDACLRMMVTHLPRLRRYALGLSGNASMADDLVQECIARALRHLDALQNVETMAGWLRSILYNAFIDSRRQMKRHHQAAPLYPAEHGSGDTLSPDRTYEAQEALRAMTLLSEQHRQVLLLVGVEGLSYRAAADELGVPLGTVMSRLARARDQLRALMERGVPGPQPLPFGRRP